MIAVIFSLVLLLALVGGYSFWRLSQAFPRAIPFDDELWQTADLSKQDNLRCLMQRDIRENDLKLAMTKAEVVAGLGELEENEQTTSYYLGFCSPFGVDAMALGLEFDTNDTLSRIYDIQY